MFDYKEPKPNNFCCRVETLSNFKDILKSNFLFIRKIIFNDVIQNSSLFIEMLLDIEEKNEAKYL